MFDLLYLNGRSLLGETFAERRRLMYEHFNEVDNELIFAEKRDTDNIEEIQEFFDHSKKGSFSLTNLLPS